MASRQTLRHAGMKKEGRTAADSRRQNAPYLQADRAGNRTRSGTSSIRHRLLTPLEKAGRRTAREMTREVVVANPAASSRAARSR